MNWGKRNEFEISFENRCRWRLIFRSWPLYLALLWSRVRLVWRSDHEGETIVFW